MDKPGEYGKYFLKINFNSHHNFRLNKVLKLYNLIINVRSVFPRRQEILSTSFLR